MGKTFVKQLIVGLLLLGGASLFAQDTMDANDTKKRIVILGDSITAGYGLDPGEAYPALIQRKLDAAKLPYTVSNAGVSGDTTAGGLRRVDWVMAKGADILVIALGGNDGLRGTSPEVTKKNLLGIAEKARAKNPSVKILVAGMRMPESMGAAFSRRFATIFPEAAKESKATLVPYLLEGVGGVASLNQPDRIHPTAAGQKKVAENVWKVMRPSLAR